MTYKATPQVDQAMSLQEYVDYVYSNIDILDIDSLKETAWALKALSNYGEDIVDGVNAGLQRFVTDPFNRSIFTPHSVILASERGFVVRANLWVRPSNNPALAEIEIPLFSYETPHDHNFHLVTVGHLGSGYETELYTYEHSKVLGYPGEPVHINYLGKERLGKGDVMVYEAGVDIHRQLFPAESSVSINLLINHDEMRARPQYLFDVENSTIARHFADDQIYARNSLLKFATELHNDETRNLLLDIARENDCFRTRAHALLAFTRIAPNDQTLAENLAHRDSHQATGRYFDAMRKFGEMGLGGRTLIQPLLDE
ncbi:MAG: hypothetical protein V4476_11465 [Pseudomonadota bacterium]